MQAQALTFDTHAFVKRLTRAGMPEDQAEVLANGQSDLYERLVTKEYFQFTLNHELEKLRAELKHDIDKVQANLEITRTELKRDIKEMEQKLTIKFGSVAGHRHHRYDPARQTPPGALSAWTDPQAGMTTPPRPLVPDATPRLR